MLTKSMTLWENNNAPELRVRSLAHLVNAMKSGNSFTFD